METSLKTGFAQIFSCCPKNLSCPKFWGGGCSSPRPFPPPPDLPGLYAYDSVHIDGYSCLHKCRADKHGGGVGIFVNSSIKHTPRVDLSFFEPEILETVFLEIEQPHQGNIILLELSIGLQEQILLKLSPR